MPRRRRGEAVKTRVENIITQALSAYGPDAQLVQLMEECSELAVAAAHYRRNREGARYALLEELADVRIMSMQIEHLLDPSGNESRPVFERKLERLAAKLALRSAR